MGNRNNSIMLMSLCFIECRCNNQGNHCNQENGKCYCTTKGIIGDNCEKCDTNNHYLGDPSNHGSCFCK